MRGWKSLWGRTGRCRKAKVYVWWEIHRSTGIWLYPEAKESSGRILSRDFHAQICASGKLSLPAGRKKGDIRGRGPACNVSPEEVPSVNHQPGEGIKRGLCCDAAPQEVSSRNPLLAWRVPYLVPLWGSHKAAHWVWESHRRATPLGWCSPLWPGLEPHVSQTDPNLVLCHRPCAATHNHPGVTSLG